MLGTVLGDIVGSVYEFRTHRSKLFQPLFHSRARFTDDHPEGLREALAVAAAIHMAREGLTAECELPVPGDGSAQARLARSEGRPEPGPTSSPQTHTQP